MRIVGALLLFLWVSSGRGEEDEGVWNGGFYEWVWGPPGSLKVGGVINATAEIDEEPKSKSLLKSFLELFQSEPEVRDDLDMNVNPLWETDDQGFPANGLEGVLVKSDPVHACKKVDPHPEYPTFKEEEIEEIDSNSTTRVKTKWILIVDEGKCNIATKMTNAERAGYSALLLISSDPTSDEDLVEISKRKIFAAKIAVQDGLTLIENYAYPEPVDAKLEDIRDQQWSHAIWKIIVMIIVALIIVTLIIAILIKIWKIYKRRQADKEAEEIRETLRRSVENMPITVWELNSMTQGEKCNVCYGLFAVNDIVRTLPCFHRFHQRCIMSRFEKGNTECAVCHYQVLTPHTTILKPKSTETTPLL